MSILSLTVLFSLWFLWFDFYQGLTEQKSHNTFFFALSSTEYIVSNQLFILLQFMITSEVASITNLKALTHNYTRGL